MYPNFLWEVKVSNLNEIIKIHRKGKLKDGVNPKKIVIIHTENKEYGNEIFGLVKNLSDNQEIVIFWYFFLSTLFPFCVVQDYFINC